LKAIDETRCHLFFGRERETLELIERLSTTHLLMVTGDSGSGKSSLVRAGLVPRWRGGALAELKGRRPDEEIWHVIEARPGLNPRRALGDAVFAAARRLCASAADCGTYKDWVTTGNAEQIRDDLRCGLDADRTRTLVVVDQLEELLTLAPKEHRRPYVELLLALADPSDDAFSLVLTMRRDYYNLCSEFSSLYARLEADNRRARYLLGRMRDDDIQRTITEPLKLAGVDKGDREALARYVLSDVGERPGDLALIQFALAKTWQHRKKYNGDLLQSYSALGGVEGALAQAADKVYADTLGGDANEREIEAVFLRLVRLGDTRGATRRVARRSEFTEVRWSLLQSLADENGGRLVQISGAEGNETAEIGHEALVTQWPRFDQWVRAAAADKRTLDWLIERAVMWLTANLSDQYLATGVELQLFDDLAKRHHHWLSPGEIEYVERSSAAHQREEARRLRGREPDRKPEYFVSYAWGDRTPGGREREAFVDKLCAEAEKRGIAILRDKKVLGLGDRISKFMSRIGQGDRIFVVLSDKYLKSPYCMFELWRNCREEGDELLNRVRVYTLPDPNIWTPKDRALCARYWKEQMIELKPYADLLGDSDHAKYRLMSKFVHEVGDILVTLTDIVQPHTFEELVKYGFQDPGS
jgi:hypothetical protein